MGSSRVELAYIGVHQIFQMALAAEEAGWLSGLQCSLFNAPGKWGGWISKCVHLPLAQAIGAEKLPPQKVHEIPWPSLRKQLAAKLARGKRLEPLPYMAAFEKTAARRLQRSQPSAQIAVGAETCALGFFEEAKRLGMKCMLDCHGIPNRFLDAALARAAEEFGLLPPAPSDSLAMEAHKEAERGLADLLIFCSELQRDIWVGMGVPAAKTRAVPLWVDGAFWCPEPPATDSPAKHPTLRVAAVAAGSLAKGLPYLVQAVDSLLAGVELTLVGSVSPQLRPWLSRQKVRLKEEGYMTRPELRAFLRTQDLLVMPSLGDSFGFVAIEAMACGLPVIVTDHCGVPVPGPDWRVPAHDAERLAARLCHYVDHRDAVIEDGFTARSFAIQFTPERYRQEIRLIYAELLRGLDAQLSD